MEFEDRLDHEESHRLIKDFGFTKVDFLDLVESLARKQELQKVKRLDQQTCFANHILVCNLEHITRGYALKYPVVTAVYRKFPN